MLLQRFSGHKKLGIFANSFEMSQGFSLKTIEYIVKRQLEFVVLFEIFVAFFLNCFEVCRSFCLLLVTAGIAT